MREGCIGFWATDIFENEDVLAAPIAQIQALNSSSGVFRPLCEDGSTVYFYFQFIQSAARYRNQHNLLPLIDFRKCIASSVAAL